MLPGVMIQEIVAIFFLAIDEAALGSTFHKSHFIYVSGDGNQAGRTEFDMYLGELSAVRKSSV